MSETTRRPGTDPAPAWLKPLVDALDHAVVERVRQDPFQRDPAAVREWLPFFKAWSVYFGAEVRGWERLPEKGPYLVVGNHSGGAETNDAAWFLTRWVEEKGPEEPLYVLAYDLLFAYPVLGPVLPRLGMLPASPENAREALARGAAVVVFPGGDQEAFRPWSHRNRIEFGGRKGFVRLALEAGVPVVPMTIHGAHQSTFVLTRGRALARHLGLHRLHIKIFPLIWNIPFGPTLAWVPSLQLPAKVTVEIGRPIDWAQHGPEAAGDPAVVKRCYDQVTRRMQRTLERLEREHPHPVLARLNELRPLNVARRLLGRGGRS